jgi:hypothetical protein
LSKFSHTPSQFLCDQVSWHSVHPPHCPGISAAAAAVTVETSSPRPPPGPDGLISPGITVEMRAGAGDIE